MNIYRFTFPIPNYYNDGIFEKHVYFQGERCPHHDDVIAALQAAHNEEVKLAEDHPEWGPHTFEYQACLNAIEQLENERLPYLHANLLQSNTFCNTTFGRQPLSVSRVIPLSIPTNHIA